MNIAIIHTGFAKYVVYVLRQIKRTNPNSKIFLISDKEYKNYSKYSTFVDISAISSEDAKTFKEKYIHLGKSNPNYEMFCMLRWIILRDFMKNIFCRIISATWAKICTSYNTIPSSTLFALYIQIPFFTLSYWIIYKCYFLSWIIFYFYKFIAAFF